ncbi:hypothetical protein [Streptomyces albus]|uniref:hypothetical protein n=1 Tax=Streptomyces sp. NRRL F-5917 TaxID=1463873 RepID=UPI0004C0453D|nr:hypothetical protein [Streptomyces sp. NRRL F-5917]
MSTSSQNPKPDSEWETAAHQHIAELLYPTYGQRDTNRSFAIADAVMPAVRKAVDNCLLAEVARLRVRVAELERPAVEANRAEIRQSYRELAAQAREAGDYEGAFEVDCRLREREEQWKREDAGATRTERSYWVAIAEALNAAVAAGLPIGIDLDGTITDRNAWSVVWDRDRKRWAVAGYDDEGGAR